MQTPAIFEIFRDSGDNHAVSLTRHDNRAGCQCNSRLVGPRFGGAFFLVMGVMLLADVRDAAELAGCGHLSVDWQIKALSLAYGRRDYLSSRILPDVTHARARALVVEPKAPGALCE